MTDFRLASPLGRRLHKLMKTLDFDFAEPLYFCKVLEYVAHRAASRSIRKLQAKEKKVVLRKLLQELLNEDLSSTIMATIRE